VDNPKRTTYLCTFPRFPTNRPRESVHNTPKTLSSSPYHSTPRTLPPLPDQLPFHRRQNSESSAFRPRILPVNVKPLNLSKHKTPAPPPKKKEPASSSPEKKPRRVFSTSKPHPLRLVQESLNRKRRPPVFFAQSSHSVVQSVQVITIHQKPDKMASNPVMPKVAPLPTTLPGGPRPVGSMSPPQNKDQLLADLRRQLDDSASDVASSVGSRSSRRRRNRNNNKALAPSGSLTQPAILPRLADTKPVRLQLGLNLDVEVELKARLQGDVSLTLLYALRFPFPPQISN
jgi:hypothetical protein